MQQKGFIGQLPSNIITNIIYFLLNIILGIWLVPFYIKKLGIEGYGFIPLATTITFYAGIVTLSLNSAVSRYLTVHIQKDDIPESNKIFNTSIVITIFVSIAMLPAAFAISYFADGLFDIPDKFIFEGKILFLIVFISFLITFLSNPFTASTYALNRLDLSNLINIINVLVRSALVVILLVVFTPTLVSVGISFLVSAFASMLAGIIICRKISPQLKVNFSKYDKSKFGSLTKMSSWLVINQIGTMFFVNIDLIIVNIMFGPFLQGQYAAILQISILLRSLSFVVSRVTGPMVYISYAKNEGTKIIGIMKSSVKFMGVLLALPIGIICGFSVPFLKIWLGEEFVKFAPLLCLMIGHLVVNLGIQPLYSLSNAYNKVKVPGIITLVLGLANVGIAILLAYTTNLGVYAIALAGAVILTVKNGIFTTVYAAYVINKNKFIFIKPLLTGIFLTLIIFACSLAFSQLVNISSWTALIGYSFIICLPFLPLIWYFVIDKNEKDILKSIMEKLFIKTDNLEE